MEKITENLLLWYKENKRDLPWRHTRDPYCIWISEIMLQQTRVEAAKSYYENFIRTLPRLEDLANTPEDKLLKLWEGIGYYSRARNLQKAAKILIEKGAKTLPCTKEELVSLPGIGDYTAGAILSIAFDKREVAIDGNVYRVLGRYYCIEGDIGKKSTYRTYEQKMKKILPTTNTGDFIQSFMDLGSSICTPKSPKCSFCPLKENCKAKKMSEVELYPVKQKKTKQTIEERIVLLIVHKEKVAIQKREDTGLLASMYEFPNYLSTASLIDIENSCIEKKIPFEKILEIGDAKHVFSHRIWYLKGYLLSVKEPIKEFTWVTKKDLIEKYSIPSAFSYYLEVLLREFLD